MSKENLQTIQEMNESAEKIGIRHGQERRDSALAQIEIIERFHSDQPQVLDAQIGAGGGETPKEPEGNSEERTSLLKEIQRLEDAIERLKDKIEGVVAKIDDAEGDIREKEVLIKTTSELARSYDKDVNRGEFDAINSEINELQDRIKFLKETRVKLEKEFNAKKSALEELRLEKVRVYSPEMPTRKDDQKGALAEKVQEYSQEKYEEEFGKYIGQRLYNAEGNKSIKLLDKVEACKGNKKGQIKVHVYGKTVEGVGQDRCFEIGQIKDMIAGEYTQRETPKDKEVPKSAKPRIMRSSAENASAKKKQSPSQEAVEAADVDIAPEMRLREEIDELNRRVQRGEVSSKEFDAVQRAVLDKEDQIHEIENARNLAPAQSALEAVNARLAQKDSEIDALKKKRLQYERGFSKLASVENWSQDGSFATLIEHIDDELAGRQSERDKLIAEKDKFIAELAEAERRNAHTAELRVERFGSPSPNESAVRESINAASTPEEFIAALGEIEGIISIEPYSYDAASLSEIAGYVFNDNYDVTWLPEFGGIRARAQEILDGAVKSSEVKSPDEAAVREVVDMASTPEEFIAALGGIEGVISIEPYSYDAASLSEIAGYVFNDDYDVTWLPEFGGIRARAQELLAVTPDPGEEKPEVSTGTAMARVENPIDPELVEFDEALKEARENYAKNGRGIGGRHEKRYKDVLRVYIDKMEEINGSKDDISDSANKEMLLRYVSITERNKLESAKMDPELSKWKRTKEYIRKYNNLSTKKKLLYGAAIALGAGTATMYAAPGWAVASALATFRVATTSTSRYDKKHKSTVNEQLGRERRSKIDKAADTTISGYFRAEDGSKREEMTSRKFEDLLNGKLEDVNTSVKAYDALAKKYMKRSGVYGSVFTAGTFAVGRGVAELASMGIEAGAHYFSESSTEIDVPHTPAESGVDVGESELAREINLEYISQANAQEKMTDMWRWYMENRGTTSEADDEALAEVKKVLEIVADKIGDDPNGTASSGEKFEAWRTFSKLIEGSPEIREEMPAALESSLFNCIKDEIDVHVVEAYQGGREDLGGWYLRNSSVSVEEHVEALKVWAGIEAVVESPEVAARIERVWDIAGIEIDLTVDDIESLEAALIKIADDLNANSPSSTPVEKAFVFREFLENAPSHLMGGSLEIFQQGPVYDHFSDIINDTFDFSQEVRVSETISGDVSDEASAAGIEPGEAATSSDAVARAGENVPLSDQSVRDQMATMWEQASQRMPEMESNEKVSVVAGFRNALYEIAANIDTSGPDSGGASAEEVALVHRVFFESASDEVKNSDSYAYLKERLGISDIAGAEPVSASFPYPMEDGGVIDNITDGEHNVETELDADVAPQEASFSPGAEKFLRDSAKNMWQNVEGVPQAEAIVLDHINNLLKQVGNTFSQDDKIEVYRMFLEEMPASMEDSNAAEVLRKEIPEAAINVPASGDISLDVATDDNVEGDDVSIERAEEFLRDSVQSMWRNIENAQVSERGITSVRGYIDHILEQYELDSTLNSGEKVSAESILAAHQMFIDEAPENMQDSEILRLLKADQEVLEATHQSKGLEVEISELMARADRYADTIRDMIRDTEIGPADMDQIKKEAATLNRVILLENSDANPVLNSECNIHELSKEQRGGLSVLQQKLSERFQEVSIDALKYTQLEPDETIRDYTLRIECQAKILGVDMPKIKT